MKGVESTIPKFIAMVILCIVSLFIMLTYGQKVLAFIQERLFGGEMSKLEKAILCSYYRCVDGCGAKGADTTDKFCSEFEPYACANPISEDPKIKNDPDLRVCDGDAQKYPLFLEVTNPQTLSKDIPIKPTCIIPNSPKDEWQKAFIEGIANNWIIVDNDFIKSREREACDYSYSECLYPEALICKSIMSTTFDATKSISVAGKMYIFELTEPGTNRWRVDLRKTPCDIFLTKDTDTDVEFFSGARSINYRLICIKDSEYKTVFKFSLGTGSADVEIDGIKKTISQNREEEWHLPSGHRFIVRYKGERVSQPSAPNKAYFTIRYELTPVQPGCKCPGKECLPSDNNWDAWTESKDNWYSASGYDLDQSDVKCGKYAIRLSFDATFNVEEREGKKIDLKLYDKVHLWVKSPSDNANFKIKFVSEVGRYGSPKSLDCKFTLQSGWNEIWIDLKNWQQNCEKGRYGFDWDPINHIDFYMMENRYWVDNLYLVKY
jgi:hypothetical protein